MFAYDPSLPVGDCRELMPFEADEYFSVFPLEENQVAPIEMPLRFPCPPAEACTEIGIEPEPVREPLVPLMPLVPRAWRAVAAR